MRTVASFTKEVNWRLAKRPLVFNGRLANHQLTSLIKEATDVSANKHWPTWTVIHGWYKETQRDPCLCNLVTRQKVREFWKHDIIIQMLLQFPINVINNKTTLVKSVSCGVNGLSRRPNLKPYRKPLWATHLRVLLCLSDTTLWFHQKF